MKHHHLPCDDSRSGIALVIVLALLSIMVLLGLAFAVSMRTERVAAGAYAEDVRGRELLNTALARAISALHDSLDLTNPVSEVFTMGQDESFVAYLQGLTGRYANGTVVSLSAALAPLQSNTMYYVTTNNLAPGQVRLAYTYEDACRGNFVPTGGGLGIKVIRRGSVCPPWSAIASVGVNYGPLFPSETNAFLWPMAFTNDGASSWLSLSNRVSIYSAQVKEGDRVMLHSTDTLPSGLDVGPYWVVQVENDPSGVGQRCRLSKTRAGAPISPTSLGVGTHFMSDGEATAYIPMALWPGVTAVETNNLTNYWTEVRTPPEAGTNLVGRVSYLIVNCSGLLDANHVGSNPNTRSSGTNPVEIAFDDMMETHATFFSRRDTDTGQGADIRYETLPDLAARQNGADGTPMSPSNFFVYSYSRPGYWDEAVTQGVLQVNLAGDADALLGRRSLITNAFYQAGFTNAGDAVIMFSNLIDYVDAGSCPNNTKYSVEATPMINQVYFSNTIVRVNNGPTPPAGQERQYTITGTIQIEMWYPFKQTLDASPYALGYTISFSNKTSSIKPDDPTSTVNSPVGLMIMPNNHYYSVSIPFAKVVLADTAGDGPGSITLKIEAYIAKLQLWSDATRTQLIDEIMTPVVLTNEFVISGNGTYFNYVGAEAIDPRVNWDPSDTNQWVPTTFFGQSGIGADNKRMQAWCGFETDISPPPPHLECDKPWFLFCRNGPLVTVGELGCLMCPTNGVESPIWRTLSFYGPNHKGRVLDVFGISTNIADDYVRDTGRGYVNPLAARTNVFAAVFSKCPMESFPGQSTTKSVQNSAATNIGVFMASSMATSIVANPHVSAICDMDWTTVFNSAPEFSDEGQRESVFRNSSGLFRTRQNLFTILLEAQVSMGGVMARSAARQRAVAIVWRDPFTGECIVRSLKRLDR